MKEELQGKLVEILTSIQVATGKASDFAMVQLPDIAQSYVLYGRISSSIEVAFWLLALGIGLYALRWSWKNPKYSTYSWDAGKKVWTDGSSMSVLLSCVFSFSASVGLFSAINSAALVWFAPKVWLLKSLAGMIK